MIRRAIASLTALGGVALIWASAAQAAEPPRVASATVVQNSVTATSVTLQASIDPEGSVTTYRFEFLTAAEYEANLAAVPVREAFAGARFSPLSGSGDVGGGTTLVPVSRTLQGLAPATEYRYRVRVTSSAGTAFGPDRPFATRVATNSFS